MRRIFLRWWLLSAGLLCSLSVGCARWQTPPNLEEVKQDLVSYYESGAYAADCERALKPAHKWLERRACPDEKLAVVLDIDETALSNWPQLEKSNFCYDGDEWAVWIQQSAAPAVPAVLELYKHARQLGYGVFMVTGRRVSRGEATTVNLKAVGYDDCEALIYKPLDVKTTGAAAYKAPVRARIESQGWKIVLNVGDQQSDLDGGYAEMGIKLPNPFYTVQ